MTRTLIGFDSDGIPCVKITKGSINPVTEPDTNYGSFLYNSNWAKDVKLAAIDANAYSSSNKYSPSGATISNYQKAWQNPYGGSAVSNYVGIRNSFFGSKLYYDLPVFDIKIRRLSDNHYIEQNRLRFQGTSDNLGREPGYFMTSDRGISAWFDNRPDVDSNTGDVIGALGNGLYYFMGIPGVADANDVSKEIVIWQLPADNTAISNGILKTPLSGQRSIEITSDYCRVAKPGFDVRTATGSQLAFDSSKRPLAAIYADDVALPVGTTQIDVGYAVNPRMICDMYLYTNNEITFPMSRYGVSLVAEYWFSGTTLFIKNTATACRARFVVFANDQQGSSSGTNKVLRQFTSNGQKIVQLLRPGAADPPAFADVVIDSRWPTLSMLAEGYQSIGSQPNKVPTSSVNAGQSFSVAFNNSGLLPIVKYMTVHQSSLTGKSVKFPQTLITENYNNSTQYHQGNSTYCVVSANQATFWTFRGNPRTENWNSNDGWTYTYPDDPIVGIRYFIMGIST
jgi:hypothetical protein